MSAHTVEIQIDELFRAQVPDLAVRKAALVTLAHEEVEGACDVSVVLSDDDTLHELNMRFRGTDSPTDVLAFPNEARGPFVDAPSLARYLGDVVISFPRAQAQAAEMGHDVLAEVQLLVVHGMLHLLGRDDVEVDQRVEMWRVQGEILRALGVKVHLPD